MNKDTVKIITGWIVNLDKIDVISVSKRNCLSSIELSVYPCLLLSKKEPFKQRDISIFICIMENCQDYNVH